MRGGIAATRRAAVFVCTDEPIRMIGNDVVDLHDADSRIGAHHPRFDERVFGAGERGMLARSENPECLRWIFWAAKESAYKLRRRGNQSLPFSPATMAVEMAAHGLLVRSPGFCVSVRCIATADLVHAVACDEAAWPRVRSAVWHLPPSCGNAGRDSEHARRFAIAMVAPALGTSPRRLAIQRRARIPVLLADGRELPGALSLSHHGRFVAFAHLAASPAQPARRAAGTGRGVADSVLL